MQTQQVLGVDRGGMMYSSKSAPAKSSDNSFDQLIQMSQNAGAAEEAAKKPAETAKKDPAADVKKAGQPKDTASAKTDTSATAEEKPELQKAEEVKEATDVEAAERAAGILAQVTEAVKDVLGLTDEQLNAMLEELGITELNLLHPESLQNLVLMANSEQDAVVLLTDAELLSTVNRLIEQVEQVLEEAGVTPEELVNVLEDPDFEALVKEAAEQMENTDATEEPEKTSAEAENVTVERSEVSPDAHSKVAEENPAAKDFKDERNADTSADADRFAEQFIQNLQKAAGEIGEVSGQTEISEMIREIADQILEKVKVSVTAETTSLEIVLTPEELGKVNLTVTADQDGTMKAKFVTENELAKEAIERNLVQFKETLQEQGLKVDTIEVTVGSFEFDKNGQANESGQEEQKHGNRRFMADEELGQKEDTDQLARIFMEGGESTVNYMA